MGIWTEFFGRGSAPLSVQSPWSPSGALETFVATDVFNALDETHVVTRDIALKVPGMKRAHGIHCANAAGIPLFQMDGEQKTAEQPRWLTNTDSGVSPYHRMYGLYSDLFMNGWGLLGFTADMQDCLHVPYGMWGMDAEGAVAIDKRIPERYRARPVAIPLGYGNNGVLIDGADTIRASRQIESVWIDRINNPLPATELHIEDSAYDQMSSKEKRKLVDEWNANRARGGGQTAVTQSFMKVNALGQVSSDLFEKGRNAVRLDIANHASVPASIIEGSKDSGGSDIEYTGKGDKRNELYEFGTKQFVQAVEARLSLDDVCAPRLSIRGDLSGFLAIPTPNSNPTSDD